MRLKSPRLLECAVRVAVVFKDRCQPKGCHLECIAFCPPQRTGTEVIWIDPETTKAAISEETCISCGICVRKCPFDAIRIIGLRSEERRVGKECRSRWSPYH